VVGCLHSCKYCVPSFQVQAKRMGKRCLQCYRYYCHLHPERLNRVPKGKFIFVVSLGDLFGWWVPSDWIVKVLRVVAQYPGKTFLFLTKNPCRYLEFEEFFPENAILGVTIETDSSIYAVHNVSKAPAPVHRYFCMTTVKHPRKMVSIEPIMDFDMEVMVGWIKAIKPEFVYIGYDSRKTGLVEPPLEKTLLLGEKLREFTVVKYKLLRDPVN